MDRSQLNSLKRSQLQQLARRESLKANMKSTEIIRLLLEKYPDGVPEVSDKPSGLKRSTPPKKTKQPVRRSKRKSAAKSELPPAKAKTNSNLPAQPALNESDVPQKGRDVRSMAPPPITPLPSGRRWLPKTPLAETAFEPPLEATAVTSHQVHEMLRGLTGIINTVSLDPKEPSSILYRARALNAILDAAIVPRMMKVDKDVKDIAWMRVAVEENLGPLFKEKGMLPESRHNGVFNARPDSSFPAPRSPSPKRPREEGIDPGVPPPAQPSPSKRAREH